MLVWMILTAVVCVLLGIILTLWIEWHLFSHPARQQPSGDDDIDPLLKGDKSMPLELPPELVAELGKLAERAVAGNSGGAANNSSSTIINDEPALSDETLLAVNLMAQFFFRELRSQGKVRRFLLNRINHEMEELLTKGAVSKIIKGLKIYDIEMGTRAPSIHQIRVHSVRLDDEKKEIDCVNFDLDVDYSGGLGIAIDVNLAYGKSAFLSAKVGELKGQVRLTFSRRPYSHWSVAFATTPQLKVEVASRVQGRSFSHVTSLISAQIHKWIQRKHTLPTSRMRHKPFFPPPDQLLLPPPKQSLPDISLKGFLEVTVVEVSRLHPSLQGEGSLCCTMALDSCSWINTCSSELEGHVILEIRVAHKRHQRLGIQFHPPSSSDSTPMDENKSIAESKEGAVIMEVETGTAADEAGLRVGDTVLEVDETVIRSADDVAKAVAKTKAQCVVIRVDRYISRKRAGSTFLTPSPSSTFDGLNDKSPLATPSEEMSGNSLSSSSLLLPLGSHLESPLKPRQGPEVKRTIAHPLDKAVYFGDKVTFQVVPGQRFLNLTLLLTAVPSSDEIASGNNKASSSTSPSKTLAAKSNLSNLFKKHSPLHHSSDPNREAKESTAGQKETRPIGHVNIFLPEVAADCQLNTQGHHINTYQLYPADLKAHPSSPRHNPLQQQPGFDSRLCYGDIVLSFVHRPDKKNDPSSPPTPEADESDSPDAAPSLPPTLPLVELAQPAIEMIVNETKRQHDFIITQFVHSRLCDFCRKKIWLREAFQCRSCSCVCHKKCIKRYPDREVCNGTDLHSSSSSITVEVPKVEIAVEENNPFYTTNDDDEIAELESAVERLQLMEHNEMLIRMAKDSGKELHCHLENSQRRLKINSMLQRLEAATEAETIRRYELAAFLEKPDGQILLSTDERKEMEKEAASCESRRQALVLLLLHYSAGLRSAEEAEEARECEEANTLLL